MNGSSERVALVIDNSPIATSKANGSVPIKIYAIPEDGTFTPGGSTTTLLTTVHPTIHVNPGGSQQVTFTVPIASSLAAGNYQLVAVIGANNASGTSTLGSNNNNVVVSAPFAVTQRNFDLASTIAMSQLPTVVAGTPANGVARVTVTNTAASTATVPAGTQIPVQVIARPLGATGTSSDVVLGTTTLSVGNLRPGASRTITVPLSFPATMTAGGFNLVASANGSDILAETNTVNDQSMLAQTLTVQPAGTLVTQLVPGLTTQPVNLTTAPGISLSAQPVTSIIAQPVAPFAAQPITSIFTQPVTSPGFTLPNPTIDVANTPTFTNAFPTLTTSPGLTPSPTFSTAPALNNAPTLIGVNFPTPTTQVNSATGFNGLSPTNLNLFPTSTTPITLGGTTGTILSPTFGSSPASILLISPANT